MVSITRKELNESFLINSNFKLEKVELPNGVYYHVIKDILKDPEKAKSLLDKYPVIVPPDNTYTPGGRQNFSYIDLFPLLQFYCNISRRINPGNNYLPESFVTASNVVPKDPMVWEGSWFPHTDYDLVFNLWLCDWTEGTGLFTWNGNKSEKDTSSFPDPPLDTNNIVAWQNPSDSYGFEHYHTIPCQYNSLTIYDGTLYHGTIMGEGTGDRYSLISFYEENISRDW